MKIRKYLSLALIVLSISAFADGEPSSNKDIFWNAETSFYEKDYKEALAFYKSIYKDNLVSNSNLNYRIGVCYLKGYNKQSEKVKAIQYLEKAVKSVSKDYKEGQLTETNAPEDAYIYLGDSYLIANKLDNAIKAYEEFKTVSGTTDEYFLKIVNRKIETCKSAKELKALSVKFELKNYGKVINNQFANYNGVMSGDGNVYVFTSDMKFYEAIMYSKKVNGKFTTPINFNVEAKVEGSIRSLSLNSDGTEMFVFKKGNTTEPTGNIFVSNWVDGKWSELKKLNKNINTSDLEMHASLSPDDSTLYFSSNRKGGYGSLDIYKSKRQKDGTWGKAENLGENINSEFDERSPFVIEDGKTMYFSSQGHTYNIGGNDFFMSKIDDNGNWSKPLNFGFPINTTDDNLFMYPIAKNKAIIAMATDDGFGDLDLYELTFYPEDAPSVIIKGKLNNKGKEIAVEVKSGDGVKKATTNTNGEFEIVVPAGDGNISLTANNMEPANKNVTAPKVYCLAEIDVSDIELKHIDVEVATNDDSTNSNANNVGDNNTNNSNATAVSIKTILFGFNKDIPDVHYADLDHLATYLNSVDNILIEIQGYADLQGDEAYNMILSKRRANYVKNYLIKKGVAKNKIRVKGFGEANQISSDLNPSSRKYNRRVNFKVIRDEAGKITFLPAEIPEKYKLK